MSGSQVVTLALVTSGSKALLLGERSSPRRMRKLGSISSFLCECPARFFAHGAGVAARLALRVVPRMLFALSMTIRAHLGAKRRKFLRVPRTHRSQTRHRAAHREHLLHRLRTICHHRAAGRKIADAVFKARLADSCAVSGRFGRLREGWCHGRHRHRCPILRPRSGSLRGLRGGGATEHVDKRMSDGCCGCYLESFTTVHRPNGSTEPPRDARGHRRVSILTRRPASSEHPRRSAAPHLVSA